MCACTIEASCPCQRYIQLSATTDDLFLVMTAQTRNVQPRPLSLIIESPGSGECESSFYASTSDSPEILSSEKLSHHRSGRRLAVAPLHHPVLDLTHDIKAVCGPTLKDKKVEEVTGQDTGISCLEIEKEKTKYGDLTNCDKTYQKHAALATQQEQLALPNTLKQLSVESNKFYISQSRSNNSEIIDAKDNEELYIEEPLISSVWSHTNSARTSIVKDIDRYKTGNRYETNNEDMKKLNTEATITAQKVKDIKKREDAEEVDSIDSSKKYESCNSDEKDSTDKEQEDWKNTIRKVKSFTSFSTISRPLRRSVGSFDSTTSAFLPRYSLRYPKTKAAPGDSKTAASECRFYIPSEGDVRQEDTGSSNVLQHLSVMNEREGSKPLTTVRTSPVFPKTSWHGFYRGFQNKDAETLCLGAPSKHPANLGSKITNNIQTCNRKFSSGLSGGEMLKSTNRKQVIDGIQSVSPTTHRISTVDQSDFSLLKDTATRLKLPTRRLSTMVWRKQYIEDQSLQKFTDSHSKEKDDLSKHDTTLTPDQMNRINESLSWLQQELVSIYIFNTNRSYHPFLSCFCLGFFVIQDLLSTI